MRCREAQRLVLESRLGLLDGHRLAELRAHALSCARCAALDSEEDRWVRDLAALREPLPFEIDVRSRVLDAIPARRPGGFPWAVLRPWLTPAAVAVVAMSAVFAVVLALVPDLAGELRPWTAGVGAALPGLKQPLISLLGALKGVGLGVLKLVQLAGQVAMAAEPLLRAALLTALVTTLGISALVLGRDLRRMPSRKES